MKDERKTKAQLISELDELRRAVGKLKDARGKPGGVEDELKKERDYLESILGTAPVIILVLDTKGRIVSFNPFMENLSGYSFDEARGKDWFETFLPNGDWRSIRKIFRETVGDIDTSGTTNPIVTKDGNEIEIEWSNKTLKDKDGNVIGVLAVGQDITERREIENVARIQRELAISLGPTSDMESALEHLLDAVLEVESIDSGGIYLVDEGTGDLHIAYSRGLSKAFVKKVSHYEYDFPSTRLAHLGKPVYGSHSEISPKFDEIDKAEGLRALAVIPVMYEGRLLACLNLASHKYDEIPVAARNSLEAIAAHLGGIIARLRAEDALRDSEERYRLLFENSPVAIGVTTSEGKFLELNDAAAEMLGFTREELRRTNAEKLYKNPEDRELITESLMKEGYVRNFETELICKGGSTIYAEMHIVPYPSEGENLTLSVVEDITSRRIAEEGLRESENRLRTLFDDARDAIIIADTETGIISDVNNQAEKLLGKPREEIIGLHQTDLHPEDIEDIARDIFAEHIATGGREPGLSEILTSDGRRIPVEINASTVEIGGRKLIQGIFRDISERVKAEQALRASEEKYRAVVENASQCIIVVQDEQIKYSNPMVHEVLGYTWDDLTFLGPYGVVHPEDREVVIERHKKRMKGEGVEDSYQHRLIRKDGQAVWVHANAVLIEWAGRWAVMILSTDITDRKKAEDALRRSEREKAIVLDTVSEFACFYGRDYRFIWANRITAETLGVTPEELVGRYCFELWHNRSEPCEGCPSTIAFETGRPVEVEIDKGTDRAWFVRSYPVFDEEGNVSGAVEVATDITERRKMEAALRDSEEQLRLITDSLPAMIGYVDSNQCYQFVNKAYEKMFKKPKADIIGRHIREMVGRDGYETIRGYLETALSGKTVSFETRITLIDGTSLYVHGTYIPDFDEDKNVRGFFALVTDITERKEAERDLHLMQFSIEKAADSVLWVLPDAKIINVNHAACRVLGYSRDELLGMTIHDIDPLFTEEVWPEHWEDLRKRESFTIQTQHCRKDGTTFPVEILLNHIEFDGQEYNFAFVRDITDRKRAEEERRKMVEEIRHAQKLESLAVLAGGVAHDFNNLLMGILGFSELAQMELGPESPARHSVEQIEKAALHAADLTKQMLAYSGKGMFVVEPLNLSKLINEMSHLFKAVVSKKALLKFNLTENIPSVECDATQVRQIVMNLVTNASESIGENSGIITISTGIIDCDMAYFSTAYLKEDLEEGPYVCLEVVDTGAGMDRETRARIFDPFFTTKFTGRGLGLAAVLGIVRGHKGTIKVGSEMGKGSTFEVLLPVSGKDVRETAKIGESAAEWSGSGMLLVVDDEESVRTVAKLAMKRAGFTVITAVDGLEGVEKFREHKDEIVAVLLDMTMPRMSGKEAFREMRRIRDDIKVILSSGYNEQDATSRFSEKGLAGFIQKPYRPSELIEKLRRIMQD